MMMFLGATNVVASRPPERRPTGTPHARANGMLLLGYAYHIYTVLLNIFIHSNTFIILFYHPPRDISVIAISTCTETFNAK